MAKVFRCVIAEQSQTLEIDIFNGTPDFGTIVNVPPEAFSIKEWNRGYDKYPVGLRKAEALSIDIDLAVCYEIDPDLCEILENPTSTSFQPSIVSVPTYPNYYTPQRGTVWAIKSKMYKDGVLSTDYKVRNVFVQKQGVADEYSPWDDKLSVELADIRRDCLEQITFGQLAPWMAYLADGQRYSVKAAYDYWYYTLSPLRYYGNVLFTADHYMHFYPLVWFEFTIEYLYKKHLDYYGVLNNYIDEDTIAIQLPQRVWRFFKQLPNETADIGSEMDYSYLYACFFLTEHNTMPNWEDNVETDSVGGFLVGKGSMGDKYGNVYDYLAKEYEGCLAKDFDEHYAWNVKAVPVLYGTGDAMLRENASDKDIKFKKQDTVINEAKVVPVDTYDEAYNDEFVSKIDRSYLENTSDSVIHLHNLPVSAENVKALTWLFNPYAGFIGTTGDSFFSTNEREARYGIYEKRDKGLLFLNDIMVRVHECCGLNWNDTKSSIGDYPLTNAGEIPITPIARPTGADYDFQATSIEVQNGQNMLSVAAKARLLLFGNAAQAKIDTKELIDGYTVEYVDSIYSDTYNELAIKEGNTVTIDTEEYGRSRAGRVSSATQLQDVCTIVEQKEDIQNNTVDMVLLTQGLIYEP